MFAHIKTGLPLSFLALLLAFAPPPASALLSTSSSLTTATAPSFSTRRIDETGLVYTGRPVF